MIHVNFSTRWRSLCSRIGQVFTLVILHITFLQFVTIFFPNTLLRLILIGIGDVLFVLRIFSLYVFSQRQHFAVNILKIQISIIYCPFSHTIFFFRNEIQMEIKLLM